MNQKLLEYFKKKPVMYACSSHAFWDDKHISMEMLKAHLDSNEDGASRNHNYIQQSVQWIDSIIKKNSNQKILDLGCGPGIYAELFSTLGYQVTGIDISRRSIEYARRQAIRTQSSTKYLLQNYLEMEYQNEFDVITLIYCDFGVLKPSERKTLLTKIKRALKPNGKLILDVFTKQHYRYFQDNKALEYKDTGFWNKQPYACITSTYKYPSNTYLEQYIVITNHQCTCYNLWNQAFTRTTLKNELQSTGFTNTSFFSNVCGDPYQDTSPTLCVVAI